MGVERPAAVGRGGRLSNTWLTYPRDGDNRGKLRLIPDRRGGLEGFPAERDHGGYRLWSARGWGCGPSGSWRGNGPPSLRRVGAVRAGAPRWALRQGPRSYGAHQARKLRNVGNRDGATPSAPFTGAFPRCK